MGLLEKALAYKKEINRKGLETLIDKIQGPADTEMIDNDSVIESSGKTNTQSEITSDVEHTAYQKTEEKNITINSDIETESDDGILNDDNLFDLPEEDDSSPLNILEEDKIRRFNSDKKAQEDAKSRSHSMGIVLENEEDNPLGPEDEPILMKTTEIKSGKSKKMHMERPDQSGKTADMENNIPAKRVYSQPGKNTESPEIEILNAEPLPEREQKADVPHPVSKAGLHGGMNGQKIQDFITIYEIGKEISRIETEEELYNVILFLVMGQLGTSSSSILIANDKGWNIASSSGIKIKKDQIYFDPADGIINELNNDILDIETYRGNPAFSDQYNKLLSIDTRLLSPIKYKNQFYGALILGDKITGDAYSDSDKDFIISICEASAIEFNKIKKINKLQTENEKLKNDILISSHFNDLREEIIKHSSLKTMSNIISKEFKSLGINSYAVFINYNKDDDYIPQFVEEEDFLLLMESQFKIDRNSLFITYIERLDRGVIIEDMQTPMLSDTFNESQLRKMSILALYPFKMGNRLIGFIAVFRLQEDKDLNDLDIKLQQFSKVLFPGILTTTSIDIAENLYTDSFEPVFKKIKSQLENSKDLNIPLTLILFSIKNFKRYCNLYGYDQSKELTDNFIGIIKSKLSDTDFAFRFGRNKILIVLPGKDKKFATPFATTIRSELMQKFRKREKQLLITFLTSEYPVDGENIAELLDNID